MSECHQIISLQSWCRCRRSSPWCRLGRKRFDTSAAHAMPAHVGLLFPFLSETRLTDDVLTQLHALFEKQPALEVEFPRTARLPGVLYLDPQPADVLRKLTEALAGRWPEAPPYGGEHKELIPHLTVACAADAVLDAVELELKPSLPLVSTLKEATLYVFDDGRWQARARLPFRQARSNDQPSR